LRILLDENLSPDFARGLTCDWRMHRNKVQRAAMAQAGIGVFILTGKGKLGKDELALLLHRRIGEMLSFAEGTEPPFVAGVPQKGAIRLLKGA
jgi:hypothetical protein